MQAGVITLVVVLVVGSFVLELMFTACGYGVLYAAKGVAWILWQAVLFFSSSDEREKTLQRWRKAPTDAIGDSGLVLLCLAATVLAIYGAVVLAIAVWPKPVPPPPPPIAAPAPVPNNADEEDDGLLKRAWKKLKGDEDDNEQPVDETDEEKELDDIEPDVDTDDEDDANEPGLLKKIWRKVKPEEGDAANEEDVGADADGG